MPARKSETTPSPMIKSEQKITSIRRRRKYSNQPSTTFEETKKNNIHFVLAMKQRQNVYFEQVFFPSWLSSLFFLPSLHFGVILRKFNPNKRMIP